MFNREFWRKALERAVKTAAQSALLALTLGTALANAVNAAASTAPQVNAFTVAWVPVAGFAVGGFVVSVLTSLASLAGGPEDDPSLV